MRLVVRKSGSDEVNEFRFNNGPIHIGRHTDSQIFLPDRAVSRHHAVIFDTEDGKWLVEDLNSANKTYLDDIAIKKAEVKDGSVIRIADFLIEAHLEKTTEAQKEMQLEDTLAKTAYGLDDTVSSGSREPQIITRRTDFEHAPDIMLPIKRAKDFIQATEAICGADTQDEMISSLLDIAKRQFNAFHCWCALRNEPAGSMTAHSGRKSDGSTVQFSDIKFNDKITEAIEKQQFLLMPRVPVEFRDKFKINSVMIGPVISRGGCYGVFYIDNDMSHDHYNLSDLDYLMLLSIHTAAILKHF